MEGLGFLKLPLAAAALSIPGRLAEMSLRKMQMEREQKDREQQAKLHAESLEAAYKELGRW